MFIKMLTDYKPGSDMFTTMKVEITKKDVDITLWHSRVFYQTHNPPCNLKLADEISIVHNKSFNSP